MPTGAERIPSEPQDHLRRSLENRAPAGARSAGGRRSAARRPSRCARRAGARSPSAPARPRRDRRRSGWRSEQEGDRPRHERLEEVRHERLTDRTEEDREDRDPDLHRRDEAHRLVHEAEGRPRPSACPVSPSPEPRRVEPLRGRTPRARRPRSPGRGERPERSEVRRSRPVSRGADTRREVAVQGAVRV